MTNTIPTALSTFSLRASSNVTMKEVKIVNRVVALANPPEISWGKNNNPIPMERLASIMQLPYDVTDCDLVLFFTDSRKVYHQFWKRRPNRG